SASAYSQSMSGCRRTVIPSLMQRRIECLAHLVEHALQIIRQRALELHAPPVSRVGKHEARGVEEGAVEMRDRAEVARHAAMDAAVERVADNRVADRAEVHANLMRAAGVDRNMCERQHAAEMFSADDAGHGLTAASDARRLGGHLLPVRGIAPDRR